MDREFIAERQKGLQTYLDSITQNPLLCSSLPVKKFLDPNNYSANYTGLFCLGKCHLSGYIYYYVFEDAKYVQFIKI